MLNKYKYNMNKRLYRSTRQKIQTKETFNPQKIENFMLPVLNKYPNMVSNKLKKDYSYLPPVFQGFQIPALTM